MLKALKGVSKVEVTLSPGEARVDHDRALASVEQIKAAIEEAGFEAAS